MEKLIPLLNERHNLEWVLWSNVNWDYLFVKWDKENKFYEEQIISKKFWFIKRLVEKHKINTRNLNLQVFMSMFSNDGTVEVSYEELILMLLAISDNPIEFLISVLK
jgi:hypothetical protein